MRENYKMAISTKMTSGINSYSNIIIKMYYPTILLVFLIGCNREKAAATSFTPQQSQHIQKQDLNKIKWLEGNWEATWADKPYYARFSFHSDSSMELVEVLEYSDQIHHVTMNLTWQDEAYYLGRFTNKSFKAIAMSEKEVLMEPVNELNKLWWTNKGDSMWRLETIYPKEKQTFYAHRSKIDPDTFFHQSQKHKKLKY